MLLSSIVFCLHQVANGFKQHVYTCYSQFFIMSHRIIRSPISTLYPIIGTFCEFPRGLVLNRSFIIMVQKHILRSRLVTVCYNWQRHLRPSTYAVHLVLFYAVLLMLFWTSFVYFFNFIYLSIYFYSAATSKHGPPHVVVSALSLWVNLLHKVKTQYLRYKTL